MIKQRNIALCIVFSIITFGIYALYWFVCLTNDANQESGQTDATSGGVALLLTWNMYSAFNCDMRNIWIVLVCCADRRYQSGVRRDRCNKWWNVAFAHYRYM